jgi:hypothetical protein
MIAVPHQVNIWQVMCVYNTGNGERDNSRAVRDVSRRAW